jgi:TRAP-type transport system small permease protein
MRRWTDALFRLLEAVLVAVLATMVCLVFGNVLLRYGFASGITISDEIARLLFLWITFVGSISVLRLNGHLGFTGFFDRLRGRARFVCLLLNRLLMLACCALFTWGAVQQTILNAANALPVSGLPTALAYAAAVASGLGMGLLILIELVVMTIKGDVPQAAPPEHAL